MVILHLCDHSRLAPSREVSPASDRGTVDGEISGPQTVEGKKTPPFVAEDLLHLAWTVGDFFF